MTNTQARPAKSKRPNIAIYESSYEPLSDLAAKAESKTPETARFLSEEIERARLIPEGTRASDHAQIGSRIEYRDGETGRLHEVTLVYPGSADIAAGKISVLTPVGAALIGMSAGKSITYPTRGGDRQLEVLSVVNVP